MSQITFTGTHGTGKTELAKQVALRCGVPFFPSQASKVHADLGIDPAAVIPFETRIILQQAIFNNWNDQFRLAIDGRQGFVFDRCPIDFAAYLLADAPRDLDDKTSQVVMGYVDQCIETSRQVGLLFVVDQHGQPVPQRENKASAANEAYARLVQCVVKALVHEHHKYYFIIGKGSVENRVARVNQCLASKYSTEVMKEVSERRNECRSRSLNA